MTKDELLEKIYELAFGDDAINKDYTPEQVVERLTDMVQEAEYIADYVSEEEDRGNTITYETITLARDAFEGGAR